MDMDLNDMVCPRPAPVGIFLPIVNDYVRIDNRWESVIDAATSVLRVGVLIVAIAPTFLWVLIRESRP